MKELIKKKFKDKRLLNLLDNIIESSIGLSLGNYTSQWLGNYYLNGFDHWLKETKKVKYYLRYCDDGVILSSDKTFLHELRREIQEYLRNNLKLELSNYQIFKVESRGIDFLGSKSFHHYRLVRDSIKKKFIKMIKYNRNDKSIASYKGWILFNNGKNLWNKYVNNGE